MNSTPALTAAFRFASILISFLKPLLRVASRRSSPSSDPRHRRHDPTLLIRKLRRRRHSRKGQSAPLEWDIWAEGDRGLSPADAATRRRISPGLLHDLGDVRA